MRAKFVNESYDEQFLLEGFKLSDFISRFSSLSTFKKLNILASLFLLNAGISVTPDVKEKITNNKVTIELASQKYITYNEIKNFLNSFQMFNDVDTILKDPLKLYTSNSAIDFIKDHEKLRLKAYELGDGKVTIGYGHAEPLETSKYEFGETISEAEAERIFKKDLKWCEDGIKRMFKQWKEQDIDVKITQNMFDSMVSMTYNMGVSGLRSSMFVKALKHGKYLEAANMIPYTSVKNAKCFSGLTKRREKEKDLFLHGYVNETLYINKNKMV